MTTAEQTVRPELGRILAVVSAHYGLDREAMRRRCRDRRHGDARSVYFYFATARTHAATNEISAAVARCQSDCSYGRRRAAGLMQTDPGFAAEMNAIAAKLDAAPMP
jgi:chromosomal replication initiation ATPase DnaA